MLKPYSKKHEMSYVVGVSPTIELLERRPKEVVRVLVSPKGAKNKGVLRILSECQKIGIPVETNQKIIERLSLSENSYSLAVFKKYVSVLNAGQNHVVLTNPSDMGNLGTICRTMLAFNFTNLAIIKPAVDIFDPKVIRASMGTIFSLNVELFKTFEEYCSKFTHRIYPFMCNGDTVLDEVVLEKPYSLVFGNESTGLGQEYKEIGESVRIPQSNKVDSLNLSVAVGVSLYKVRCQA